MGRFPFIIRLCPRNARERFRGTFHCYFRSERAALGGVDGDSAQKILQRLLVGGAADVQLLQDLVLRSPLKKAHPQQICPHGVVRLIVVDALINGTLPAAVSGVRAQ